MGLPRQTDRQPVVSLRAPTGQEAIPGDLELVWALPVRIGRAEDIANLADGVYALINNGNRFFRPGSVTFLRRTFARFPSADDQPAVRPHVLHRLRSGFGKLPAYPAAPEYKRQLIERGREVN